MTLFLLFYLWGGLATAIAFLFSLSATGYSLQDMAENSNVSPDFAFWFAILAMIFWPGSIALTVWWANSK